MNAYKKNCTMKVTMYGLNRVLDAFCDYINRERDCGHISAEVAERQINAAADIQIAVEDREATEDTWVAFDKIREFNRKHGLTV